MLRCMRIWLRIQVYWIGRIVKEKKKRIVSEKCEKSNKSFLLVFSLILSQNDVLSNVLYTLTHNLFEFLYKLEILGTIEKITENCEFQLIDCQIWEIRWNWLIRKGKEKKIKRQEVVVISFRILGNSKRESFSISFPKIESDHLTLSFRERKSPRIKSDFVYPFVFRLIVFLPYIQIHLPYFAYIITRKRVKFQR